MLNPPRIVGFSNTISFGTVYEVREGNKQLGLYVDLRVAHLNENKSTRIVERLACFYGSGQDLVAMLIDNKQIKIKNGSFIPSDIVYDNIHVHAKAVDIYEVIEETPQKITRILLTPNIEDAIKSLQQGTGRLIRRRIGGEYTYDKAPQFFVFDTRKDYDKPHDDTSNHQRFVKVNELSFEFLSQAS